MFHENNKLIGKDEKEKQIMNKMIYCNLVSGEQALKFNSHIKEILQENEQLKNKLQQKENIIKEVREYITNSTWISTKEVLEILDKENKEW